MPEIECPQKQMLRVLLFPLWVSEDYEEIVCIGFRCRIEELSGTTRRYAVTQR